jgi:isoleucyl-tRNA synthetase
VFEHVANEIEEHGADVWYTESVEKLLPKGATCKKCNAKDFKKETDILDVWFDSGVSHAAVCEAREMGWPADLYLEGSDQHRGWFQTSLLTGVATRKRAPFKNVLTHGFVNDKEGKKMSKSKGNVTSPLDLMKTQGAEILRLWVVLEDYRNDVSFSKESLDRVSETYRKIRNSVRFLLSNLFDFAPDTQAVPIEKMSDIDRWALAKTASVLEKVEKAYESYEFHSVYHLITNLCVVDLSALYFDILKDRLYTAGKDSVERRASQTAMWMIADALVRVVAPILSFTAEEAYAFLPQSMTKQQSVFLADFPKFKTELKAWSNSQLEEDFMGIWAVRDVVLKALEESRQAKVIGHPREAKVTLTVDPPAGQALKKTSEVLNRLFLVSAVEIKEGSGVKAEIGRADGEKCARCWTYSTFVGKNSTHPDLCDRCVEALS